MADIQSNIHINMDTAQAVANLKNLQKEISAFYTKQAGMGAQSAANAANMQRNLINSINATKKFNAGFTTVKSSVETFNTALERNKMTMGEYFRYAGASTKTFGKLFKQEHTTISKVVREKVKDIQTQYIKLGRNANGALQAIKVRPLVLDMESLATKTQLAAQKQALLNQLLKQGSTQLLNWGKNTQWAGRQLMVGFTMPLAMLGSAAARTFMQMEEAVLKFQRVYGDLNTTVADTEKMTNNLKQLAAEYTKYGVSVTSTMEMAAQAAAAGKTGADLLAQVAQANKLAVLGNVDQQQALETTMSLTNAFGIAAEDLAGKIDFLNAVENQTVTSIEDLTVAVPKAAPVIKQLGGDVNDLAFFLTAMREGGINAAEGANALKSGLAAMINPTKKASDFLSGFGINLKGIVDANKGDIKATVIGFAEALNKLDPLNRARAIEQLFGKFQFARISTLFQNITKDGSQAKKVLELTRATREELAILSEREMKKIEDSPMYKFKKALEDAKAALVPLGAEFLKAVTPIIKFVGDILKKFNGMDEGAKQFITNLGIIFAGIGPVVLMTVGLIANGIANVIKLFVGIKSVFNSIGNRGKDLGSQVKYMSTEQTQAAAAAASLNQVHQKLAQTFSVERESLALLTAQYEKAVAAQMAFNGPITRRGPVGGKKVGKFARGGIIKGPGTSTSDSIIARVSRDEAVIPASSVKKYPGVVSGLISGNLPGFARGMAPATLKDASQYETVFAHAMDPISTTLEKLHKKLVALDVRIPKQIQDRMNAGFGKASTRVYGGLGFSTRQSFNEAMKPGRGGVVPKDFLTDYSSRGIKKWETSVKIGGGNMQELAGDLAKFDKALETQIKNAAKLDKNFVVTDKAMQEFVQNALKPLRKSGSKLASVLDNAKNTPTEVRGNATQAQMLAAGYKPLPERGKGYYVGPDGDTVKAGRFLKVGGGAVKAKTSRGALGGARLAQIETSTVASKKKTAAAAAKEAAVAEASAKSQARSDAARKGWETRRLKAEQQATLAAEANAKTSRFSGLGAKIGKVAGRIPSGTASMAVMAGSMLPGQAGQVAQNLMMPVMMAEMAKSLIGPAGLARLIPLLTNPITLAVAALAALAFVVWKVNDDLNKTREAAAGLAQAIGPSSKALEGLAKFAGKVTPTEVMNRIREGYSGKYSEATGKRTFGDSYMQSAEGQALAKNVKKSFSSLGSDATINMITAQLSAAIASGIVTDEQAKSIAMGLGKKLGKYSISVAVIGRLQGLGTGNTTDKVGLGKLALASAGTSAQSAVASLQNLTENDAFNTTKIAKMEGVVAESLSSQLAVRQQIMDGLELEYIKRRELLIQQGKTAEVDKLDAEYLANKNDLMATANAQIRTTLDGMAKVADMQSDNAFLDSYAQFQNVIDDKIRSKFKGTDQEKVANTILDTIAPKEDLNKAKIQQGRLGGYYLQGSTASYSTKEEAEKAQKKFAESTIVIKAAVEQGILDPETTAKAVSMFVENDKATTAYANMIMTVGGPATKQLTQLLPMLRSNKKAQEVMIRFSDMDPSRSQQIIGVLSELDKYSEYMPEIKVAITTMLRGDNPVMLDQYMAKLGNLQTLFKNGNIQNFSLVMDTVVKADSSKMDEVKGFADYFSKLDKNQKALFTQTVVTSYLTLSDPNSAEGRARVNAYRAANLKDATVWDSSSGKAMKTKQAMGFDDAALALALEDAKRLTKIQEMIGSMNGGGAPTPSGGGGATGSWLDAIVKRIRDTANWTQKLTTGFKDSLAAIKAFASGGYKIVDGLSEKMRKQKMEESFMQQVLGLSPEDWAQFKKEFMDGAGKLTVAGQQIMNTIVKLNFQDYINGLQTSADKTEFATSAMNDLVKAGLDVATAAELVKDETVLSNLAFASQADKIKLVAGQMLKMRMEYKALTEDQRLAKDNELYQAGLDVIADQEKKINDAYQARVDALETVAKLNNDIASQQKDQLDYADALSRGDIAGAAKAAQAARQANQTRAIETQKESLKLSNEVQLKNLVVQVNGQLMTREQLTAKIADNEERAHLAVLSQKQAYADIVSGKTVIDESAGTGSPVAKLTAKQKYAIMSAADKAAVDRLSKRVGVALKAGKSATVASLRSQAAAIYSRYANGGLATPKAVGIDSVPALLAPGEFVMTRSAVKQYGTETMKAINNGTFSGGSVYNYSVNVSVATDADPSQIANAVITRIQNIDRQQLRGNAI